MEVRTKLIYLLENSGIFVDEEELESDIDLREYITDSIQFVSFIVEIEREFDIEFPNELLVFDKIASLNGLANTIQSILLGDYICELNVLQDNDVVSKDEISYM